MEPLIPLTAKRMQSIFRQKDNGIEKISKGSFFLMYFFWRPGQIIEDIPVLFPKRDMQDD